MNAGVQLVVTCYSVCSLAHGKVLPTCSLCGSSDFSSYKARTPSQTCPESCFLGDARVYEVGSVNPGSYK